MKKTCSKILILILIFLFTPIFMFANTFNNEQTLIEQAEIARTNKQKISSNRELLSYYMNQKDYVRALAVCQELLQLKLSKKQKYYLYLDLAVTSKNLGNVEDSIEYFKEAEYLNLTKIDPKIMLGKIYLENGLYELAKNKFYEALQIDNKSVTATIKLADVFRAQGNFKLALEYYEHTTTLRDNLDMSLYLNMAKSAKELGLTGKAIDILENIYKSNHNKDVSILLSTLYKEQGRFKDAEEKLFSLISKTNFNDIELYANLASLYIFDKQYEKARTLLLRFKTNNKNVEVIDLLLAEVYYNLSDTTNAINLLNKILKYTDSDYIKLNIERLLIVYKANK